MDEGKDDAIGRTKSRVSRAIVRIGETEIEMGEIQLQKREGNGGGEAKE